MPLCALLPHTTGNPVPAAPLPVEPARAGSAAPAATDTIETASSLFEVLHPIIVRSSHVEPQSLPVPCFRSLITLGASGWTVIDIFGHWAPHSLQTATKLPPGTA